MSAGVVVVVVVIGFVGFQVMQLLQPVETENIEQTLTSNTEVKLTVDQSFTTQSLINSAGIGGPGVVEYSLYSVENQKLSTTLALDLVTDNFPITIAQFAADVRFISVAESRPQLLLQVNDQISMTGALLVNESLLVDSLQPLFSDLRGTRYQDRTINRIDVRVLVTETGNTSLTYGFINDNTLLIAESMEAFATVLTNGDY